ncbi:MAG: sensor histidine kinase, partial [Candidatus Sericytochromatia bacterium]
WAARQRVAQILFNLVGNSIKFTQAGGRVGVRAWVDAGVMRCEVEDNGPGIAEDKHQQLFQRFSQLDMSNTRQAGGVGLGLSIVKALVEAHGGEVGLRSTAGHGATFWFTLPLAAPEPR